MSDPSSKDPPRSPSMRPAPQAADVLAAALRHARAKRQSLPPLGPSGASPSHPPLPAPSSHPPSRPPSSPPPSSPPLASSASASRSPSGRPPSHWPSAPDDPRPKILLLADDDTVDALGPTLRELGSLVVVGDAVAAFKICESELPSVVVTDDVPRLRGLALASTLKSVPATSRVPVLVLSQEGAAGSVVAAINAGARFVLSKPVTPDLLKQRIRSALR